MKHHKRYGGKALHYNLLFSSICLGVSVDPGVKSGFGVLNKEPQIAQIVPEGRLNYGKIVLWEGWRGVGGEIH